MKFSLGLLLSTALTAFAAPSLERRAAASDVATIGYAAQAGTTGGSGGTTVTVSTLAALKEAITGDDKKVVIVSGSITGNESIRPGSNKSIVGKSGASLNGIGIRIIKVNNVIIRNIKISKVLAKAGDALGIQESKQVWIDHVDLSSDRDHDKDFYDGLLDVTHGSTGVSITNCKLHDHWKGSLVGHSKKFATQDKAITVTYAFNHFTNINSRTPSLRYGTGHIFNNFFENNNDGINTREGAQVLVENNVWVGATRAIYTADGATGYAVARGNDFGGAENSAAVGTFTTAPYKYSLTPVSGVRAAVTGSAGATLSI